MGAGIIGAGTMAYQVKGNRID